MGISKDIKRENNFKVPVNYFDYLPQEVMERVCSASEQKPFFVLKPALSFASLLILSSVAVFLSYVSQHPAAASQEYVLNENDIQYVIENSSLYNLDEHSITEEYLSSNTNHVLNMNENASEEEIQSYLEETISANTIINEL